MLTLLQSDIFKWNIRKKKKLDWNLVTFPFLSQSISVLFSVKVQNLVQPFRPSTGNPTNVAQVELQRKLHANQGFLLATLVNDSFFIF